MASAGCWVSDEVLESVGLAVEGRFEHRLATGIEDAGRTGTPQVMVGSLGGSRVAHELNVPKLKKNEKACAS